MKKLISQIIFVLILSVTIFSQGVEDKIELYDVFGNVAMGDYITRLDALATIIYESNGEKIGLIRVYGSSPDKDYAYAFQIISAYNTYVFKFRQYDSNWFRFQNCDLDAKTITTKIFLIPKDSETPKCNETIAVPQQTTRFSTRYYENPHYYFDNPYPDLSGDFPKTENELLIKLSKKSPDGKIVLIGYLGSNVYRDYESEINEDNDYPEITKPDNPKLINKILKEQKNALIKSGISSSKITTINGGYKDSTRNVEIWFVPKGGEIPKPTPDYFPKKKRRN